MSLELTAKQLEYLINMLHHRITELNNNEELIENRFRVGLDHKDLYLKQIGLNGLTKAKVEELYNKLKNERAKYK